MSIRFTRKLRLATFAGKTTQSELKINAQYIEHISVYEYFPDTIVS